jgi:hypothetical protein
MKMMVKLAVLITTLLLLTSLSFAADCDCYEITYTNLDDPTTDRFTSFVRICDSGYPLSSIAGICDDLCDPSDSLYMFFDSMYDQALISHNAGTCLAYLKFHGDDRYVLTGLWVGSYRATIRGHKTDAACTCTP